METIIDKLNNFVKNDPYFLDENGEIIKEKIKTSALNMETHLLQILLSDSDLKKAFFKDVDGILVFDKVKFSWVVSNSNFLPDSYTSFKNKIGLIDSNGDFLKSKDDVTLSFPYKDCVLEFDSTDVNENRDEIFLNETLCADTIDTLLNPKCLVDVKLHDKNGTKDINSYNGENLLIKGNNLIALNSLLPVYEGKIQCMYWDILYNKNTDFVPYQDSFKHSSWLVMMKNRLEIGRKLLKNSGIIAIQCDETEMAYLKVLCDEVFHRENFMSTVTIKVKAPAGVGQESFLFDVNEYILFYAKDLKNVKVNVLKEENELTDNVYKQYNSIINIGSETNIVGKIHSDRNGDMDLIEHPNFTVDRIAKSNLNTEYFTINIDKIMRTTNPQGGFLKKIMPSIPNKGLYSITYKPSKGNKSDSTITYHFLNGSLIVWLSDSALIRDGEIKKLSKMTNLWTENLFQGIAKEGDVELNGGKKPEKLLQRIINLCSNEGDIILDAYFGTGTTGAVAMKMGRKFIGLEQLDSHFEKSKHRLSNVINGDTTGISKDVNWNGGGSFISCELAKNNLNLVEEIMNSNEAEIIELYDKVTNSAFALNYRLDLDSLKSLKSKELFKELNLDDKKKVLVSFLEKNTIYVNYTDIEDVTNNINQNDSEFTHSFYEV